MLNLVQHLVRFLVFGRRSSHSRAHLRVSGAVLIKNGSGVVRQTHFLHMAGGKGVEPLFTESESVVLPLNDPPVIRVRVRDRVT